MSKDCPTKQNDRHQSCVIGVISDTHSLVRPEALAALSGVDLVIHAGDIGRPEVIEALTVIAPVHMIKGNIDIGAWAQKLPDYLDLTIASYRLFVLHDLKTLPQIRGNHALNSAPAVIISGHSHQPVINNKEGVMYLNPGSAGPRRFKLPVSVARLHLSANGAKAEIIQLTVAPARKSRRC